MELAIRVWQFAEPDWLVVGLWLLLAIGVFLRGRWVYLRAEQSDREKLVVAACVSPFLVSACSILTSRLSFYLAIFVILSAASVQVYLIGRRLPRKPPGFYPDEHGRTRWWDGKTWVS